MEIEVLKRDEKWDNYPSTINQEYINSLVNNSMKIMPDLLNKSPGLSILLSNNLEIQELNFRFRGKNRATNVLSFPHVSIDYRHPENLEIESGQHIGDIILAYDYMQKECKNYSKNFHNHFSHLLIHSCLHILGYDHIIDEQAEIMESKEIEILKQFDIPSPY
jgi:probable rRNA maturation factor